GASGWSTAPILAPASLIAEGQAGDLTPELDLELIIGHPGANAINPLQEQNLLLHSTEVPDTNPGWEQVGMLERLNEAGKQFRPAYNAASGGFCQVLLSPNEGEYLVPEGDGSTTD